MRKERLARIRDCAQRGLTVGETAKALGVRRCVVEGAKYRHKIPFRLVQPRNDVEAIRACAQRGLSIMQAARELGMTYSALAAASYRHGVNFNHATRGKHICSDLYAACAKWGMTINQASEFLGVTPNTVRAASRRLGLHFADQRRHWPKPSAQCQVKETGLVMSVDSESEPDTRHMWRVV